MKKLAIAGLGQRGEKYLSALAGEHRKDVELVAVCDISTAMLEAKKAALTAAGVTPRLFSARDFEQMIKETAPDTVLVLTPDYTHVDYVCRAMELGCDVIVEKPLTTTYEDCRKIIATSERTERQCAVTLNYRYSPAHQHIKHLLQSGTIGDITQVSWATGVGIEHGARFFRRWHSERAFSGSLLVHKCCHLFDLVNFWLAAVPRQVFATGALTQFGPAAAARLGLEGHGRRCGECPLTAGCPYFLDTQNQVTHNESPQAVAARGDETGYYRDKCVFREEIDTHDTISVMAEYETGAQLNFTWSATALGKGLLFRGTRGALEYGWSRSGDIVIRKYDGTAETVRPWTAEGDHGGADPALFHDLFSLQPGADSYGCRADLRDGVWSVLIGLSALESIESKRPVILADRVQVARPDFAPANTGSDVAKPLPEGCREMEQSEPAGTVKSLV